MNQRTKRIKFFSIIFFSLLMLGVWSRAEAATLSLRPSSASYVVGQNFTIRVILDSPNQAANAIGGHINFPPDLLQVASVIKGSVIDFWVEQPTFSNSQGLISFEGVAFNPGFTGNGGQVLTITFKAKTAGRATLDFEGGRILANDGQGTDITEGKNSAFITLTPPTAEATPEEASPVIISSPTHPDQNRWYKNNQPRFELAFPTSTEAVRFSVDQLATTTPTTTAPTIVAYYGSQPLTDGAWYFHAQARQLGRWSISSHFVTHIDTVPPEPFTIALPDGSQTTAIRPKIIFGASDVLSGIDHYEVYVNDEFVSVVNTTSSDRYHLVRLPVQFWGEKKIVVKAFDRAENIRESSVTFIIQPGLWVFALIALIPLILLLLAWFFLRKWHAVKKLDDQIRLKMGELLPERADSELAQESAKVNYELDSLYMDIRNLLSIKSRHKAFDYLKKARESRLSDDQIREQLRGAGWSNDQIEALLEEDRAILAIAQKMEKDLGEIKN